MRFAAACLSLAVPAVVLTSAALFAAEPSVDASYKAKADRLDDRDVDGHYKLAEWCRQQGRYDLVAREARKVLAAEPGHEDAALLLKLAERKLREERPKTSTGKPAGPGSDHLLTDADIQRLRWAELQAPQSGPAEPVRAEFSKGFLDWFPKTLQKAGERDRFRRAQPAERFQMVIDASGGVDQAQTEYADQIRIADDPRVFSEFRRAVLPEVMRGCATPACHGGSAAKGFRMVNERGQATQSLYTNFFTLQSATGKGGRRVIDRERPERSLLLQYMLPANEADVTHPPAQVPIKPMVRGQKDRTYQTIWAWIRSLRYPAPDYGVPIGNAAPAAATRPAASRPAKGDATPRAAPDGGGK